jgi:rod shape-determining protein MreD
MSTSIYVAILLMALLAILQSAVLPKFPILGLTPQLLFLVALAWGLHRGLNEGVFWAFIAGFFTDLFSLTPMGISSLTFMIATAVVLGLQQVLPPGRILMPMALATAATFIYLLLYALLMRLLGHGLTISTLLSWFPVALLHGFLILPIYLLMDVILRVLRPRRVEI